MGAAHTYGSGAELRMAANEVLEVLREAGLGPNAERLLTTTAAGENHVLFVGTRTGTDIERRVAEAMMRVKRIDGAWLLEKAAQLVRDKDCASRFGHNGSTRIDLGSLLRQAWRDLGGDLCMDVDKLPGSETLRRTISGGRSGGRPAEAVAHWTLIDRNTVESTAQLLDEAVEAAGDAGRERVLRAGSAVAGREQRLRKVTRDLHDQVHAGESAYSSSALFDAAGEALAEMELILGRLEGAV